MFRHGDLLIIPTTEYPAEVDEKFPHTTLAWGEATGHNHCLEPLQLKGEYMVAEKSDTGEMQQRYVTGETLLQRFGYEYIKSESAPELVMKDGQMYFKTTGTSIVKHQEHGTIVVPPGTYINRIQREYQPGEVPRNVID